jgi:hypothetical protein
MSFQQLYLKIVSASLLTAIPLAQNEPMDNENNWVKWEGDPPGAVDQIL